VIEPAPEGVRLLLLVQPRASRTELAGVQGGKLKLRVAAPPVDDAANLELLRFLARSLGVPRSCLTITRGEKGRHKTVLVRGLSVAAAQRHLGLPEAL
jgi:uncharacterized protein (TIGR00251 family)